MMVVSKRTAFRHPWRMLLVVSAFYFLMATIIIAITTY